MQSSRASLIDGFFGSHIEMALILVRWASSQEIQAGSAAWNFFSTADAFCACLRRLYNLESNKHSAREKQRWTATGKRATGWSSGCVASLSLQTALPVAYTHWVIPRIWFTCGRAKAWWVG